jgi:hypothetical protein
MRDSCVVLFAEVLYLGHGKSPPVTQTCHITTLTKRNGAWPKRMPVVSDGLSFSLIELDRPFICLFICLPEVEDDISDAF